MTDEPKCFVTGADGREPGRPGTLTDVLVDEMYERLAKAEARIAALEQAIAWAQEEFDEDGDLAEAILQKAAELEPTEVFLQRVRAL